MEKSRYEKYHSTGCDLAIAVRSDGDVDVSHGPAVHRHVPRPPEHLDVIGVPPVVIEITIRKVQQFSYQVEERVEHEIEEAQPEEMVRYLQRYRTYYST